MKYSPDGSLTAVAADEEGTNGLFASSGAVRITATDAEWGAIAPDGSLYVEQVEPTVGNGVMNSRGNLRVVDAEANTSNGLYAPNGAFRITGGLVFVPDIFIDSVSGNDSNDGLTLGAAKQTISSVTITTGLKIGLVRGSYWREQLGIENGAINNVQVRAVDRPGDPTARMPILDGADVASSGGWTPHATLANIYQRSWTHDVASDQLISLWEDGARLRWVASEAALDAAASGYYVPSTGAGSSTTIYYKATGAGDPASNGKVVEISKRHFGLVDGRASSGWKVYNIHTRRSLKTDGSLGMFGANTYTKSCLAEDGTRHNFIVCEGIVEDTICWKTDWQDRVSGNTMFIAAANPASGKTCTFRRCIAIGEPSKVTDSTFSINGFHAHGSAANDKYAAINLIDCSAQGCDVGFLGGVTQVFTTTRCFAIDCTQGIDCGGDQNFNLDDYVKNGPNLQLNIGIRYGLAGITGLVEGYRENAEGAATFQQGIAVLVDADVLVRRSVFYSPTLGVRTQIYTLTAGADLRSERNIVVGNTNQTAYRRNNVGTSDFNCYFPNTLNYSIAGVSYTDFATYRAANPTLDANTATTDPLLIDPANGNFGLQAGSPAIALGAGVERPNIVYTAIPSDVELAAL